VKIWPGQPYPLGATFDGVGTNFAVFSEVAECVELCLFEDGEERRVELPEVSSYVWHGYLPDVGPGARYGFRVYGPWQPRDGHRCNPAKLLLDPYARAIEGEITWHKAVFPYVWGHEDQASRLDSAPYVPRSLVINPYFDWGSDRLPRIPLNESIIYEVHVKGFTKLHPDVPDELRGTYAGLAHPAATDHLSKLGVTAVELLPVHQFVQHEHLLEHGLRNYWGYDSIGYFAPHNAYASNPREGRQVQEFKQMVRALHAAGIEVILDVVYNHTGEGNHAGPMLCFKGFDNAGYYRLDPEDKRRYVDYTGTGNSLDPNNPHVLQLVMDSLRYWIQEMHIDGFRFDLAPVLARELHEVDRLSSFFDLIQQDPTVRQAKLIAEPWDVGEGGYQVGNFPTLWSEWNGKYRDTVRDYWRGADRSLAEFGYRFTGSSDLYAHNGRKPYASVNFVTCHDGFTLHDLVSYNEKHNEDNGEENLDGTDDNRSWNCGVEGPTDDPAVVELRHRQRRNFLATLFLSQGIPMLLGGDELGRTQRGNNNAYCQDNEISWFDWEHADQALLEFTEALIAFRSVHPIFRRRLWFQDRPIWHSAEREIAWFKPDGWEMDDQDWQAGFAKSLGVFLNGDAIPSMDARGERVIDDSFYLLFNGHHERLDFTLPPAEWGQSWVEAVNTASGRVDDQASEPAYQAGAVVEMAGRSLIVLKRVA
jgi:isoamylase